MSVLRGCFEKFPTVFLKTKPYTFLPAMLPNSTRRSYPQNNCSLLPVLICWKPLFFECNFWLREHKKVVWDYIRWVRWMLKTFKPQFVMATAEMWNSMLLSWNGIFFFGKTFGNFYLSTKYAPVMVSIKITLWVLQKTVAITFATEETVFDFDSYGGYYSPIQWG